MESTPWIMIVLGVVVVIGAILFLTSGK